MTRGSWARRATIVTAFAFFALPGVANALGVTISGGTANPTWTQGTVDDISVTMDICVSDGPPGCPTWQALAFVMPGPGTICPLRADGLALFWSSGYQTGNGTVHSGPQQFTLNGSGPEQFTPNGTGSQTVCVYIELRLLGNTGFFGPPTSKVLEGPPLPCVVPRLVGLSFGDVNAVLNGAHCPYALRGTNPVWSALTEGTVLRQQPPAGTVLPGTHGAVDLWISIGPKPPCTVPSVVGMALVKARPVLYASNCNLGKIRHVYSRKVRKGRVISQSPRPGTTLTNHAKIDVVVSDGPKRCTVPRVVGMPLPIARSTLRQSHCNLGRIGYTYSRKVSKGRVRSQSHRRGTSLRDGAQIDLVVSLGRRLTR